MKSKQTLGESAVASWPEDESVPCAKCGAETDTLTIFPGGICLECYRPQGEAMARTMTAERLTAMWRGKSH